MANANIVPVAATIYWANLNRKNEMSGKYQVDLGNLSEKAVNALEMLGISVNNKGDDRGNFITVKSNYPIDPEFANSDPVDSGMVGNGTKANVAIGYYDWEFRGKKGRSPSIKKMRITELHVYGEEADEGVLIDDEVL